MSNIHQAGIRDLQAMIRRREIAIEEVVQAFSKRADEHAQLNAFLRLNDTATGGEGDLSGVPIAHKDIFCAHGEITTCGSKILENFVSPYDATVVARCRQAGAITLGRTNMDEFAMGSSGEHSAFSVTHNPWDKRKVPGGSSSGSAAAVAARLVCAATGTDTGGSIRQPAAFCGVTGIKPTYGRVSRWGLVAFASSFDQGGAIARSAEDCALLLRAMAGFDAQDSTSIDLPTEDFTRLFDASFISGRSLGVPSEFFDQGLDNAVAQQVQAAIRQFESLGAKVVEVSLPATRYAIAAYYVLTSAEASSNLSRYDGVRYGHRAQAHNLREMYIRTRDEGFGAEVKRRILTGTYVLSHGYYDAYYRRAMKLRQKVADNFAQAFTQCDFIVGPTTPNVAFDIGGIVNPVAMYLQDIYTVPVNLAGLPAISLPCGFVAGLPVGVQLIAPALGEAALLAAAHHYQQHTDYHQQSPDS